MATVEDGGEPNTGQGDVDNKEIIETEAPEIKVKIICIGDSAVGKSKLMERFLIDGYKPQQSSTYALTTFNYKMNINGQKVSVDFWDTAGQERFSTLHGSYYHQAHACIMVFDATRKITYKNLNKWLTELQEHRPNIPCLCAANKIDADMNMTKKSFNFPDKHKMPLYFVSAAKGTNVVKLFTDAVQAAIGYKTNSTDFLDTVMSELEADQSLVSEFGRRKLKEVRRTGISLSRNQSEIGKPDWLYALRLLGVKQNFEISDEEAEVI